MADNKFPDLHVGDWVRFLHCGKLVIDIVVYLTPRSHYDHKMEAVTSRYGQISFTHALEVRKSIADA